MEIIFRSFENSSLLTATKIVKAPTRIHRLLWIVFSLVMLIILSSCICISVIRYLEFSIMVQRTKQLNASTTFPAITFCNPQPFSRSAEKIWKSGRIVSPTDFNRQLRTYLHKTFANRTINNSESLDMYVMHPVFKILDRDSSYYYTYIGTEKAMEIGHKINDMFTFCEVSLIPNDRKVPALRQGTTPETCKFDVKSISSPEFFNCYTLQAPRELSHQFQKVTLVLDIGSAPTKEWTQVMSSDWSDNRLMFMIHEQDTNPFGFGPYDREQIYAKPHESVNVMYQPILHVKIKSPKQECLLQEDSDKQKVSLYNYTYNYTRSTCLFHEGCNIYSQKCQCSCSRRPESAKLPYCRRFNFSNPNPSHVLCHVKVKELYKRCLRRCTYWEYRKVIHRQHWSPDKLKLLYLKSQNYIRFSNNLSYSNTYYEQLQHLLSAHNLSEVLELPPHMEKRKEKYLQLIVERYSQDVELEEEKLLMTTTNLFSEVGGLCSLFMGLSLTFIFELFELCGIFMFRSTSLSQTVSKKRSYQDNQLRTLNQSSSTCTAPEPILQDDLLHTRTHGNSTMGWLSE